MPLDNEVNRRLLEYNLGTVVCTTPHRFREGTIRKGHYQFAVYTYMESRDPEGPGDFSWKPTADLSYEQSSEFLRQIDRFRVVNGTDSNPRRVFTGIIPLFSTAIREKAVNPKYPYNLITLRLSSVLTFRRVARVRLTRDEQTEFESEIQQILGITAKDLEQMRTYC
ncbi:hypothetical protein GF386_01330 [Candidatus Pacearchaeota archaeon]|nr:hypothetical protein [Candidatus Pacearchaeota archaeon]